MKKLILFIVAVTLLTACESTFKMDPNAMVSIRPAQGAWDAPAAMKAMRSDSVATDSVTYTHLSALEIVRTTCNLEFRNVAVFGDQNTGRGFSSNQRDTSDVAPCLKMFGTDIIDMYGAFVPEFIGGEQVVLTRLWLIMPEGDTVMFDPITRYPHEYMATKVLKDTIAYIPDATLRAAETVIYAAWNLQDNEEVYRLFNEAFVFVPVTGAEWRALQPTTTE